MPTTKEDIKVWFDEGVKQKATHLIVATDTFDYDDFPVYVKPDEDVWDKINEYSNPVKMLKVMEVYKLSLPFQEQVDKPRCFNC